MGSHPEKKLLPFVNFPKVDLTQECINSPRNIATYVYKYGRQRPCFGQLTHDLTPGLKYTNVYIYWCLYKRSNTGQFGYSCASAIVATLAVATPISL